MMLSFFVSFLICQDYDQSPKMASGLPQRTAVQAGLQTLFDWGAVQAAACTA